MRLSVWVQGDTEPFEAHGRKDNPCSWPSAEAFLEAITESFAFPRFVSLDADETVWVRADAVVAVTTSNEKGRAG